MKRKLFLFLIIGMAFSLLGLQPAQADTIDFELRYEYSGGTDPEGADPWLTATLTDDVTLGKYGGIKLSMDATNLTGTQKIGGWWFNIIDGDLDNFLDYVDIEYNAVDSGNHLDPTKSKGTGDNAYSAGPALEFDIEILFKTSNGSKFAAGDIIVYDFLFTENGVPIDVSSFLAGNASGAGPFESASHVQGIGANDGSGWIAPAPVPESSTLLLVGIGLIGLAGFGRKRFKA